MGIQYFHKENKLYHEDSIRNAHTALFQRCIFLCGTKLRLKGIGILR